MQKTRQHCSFLCVKTRRLISFRAMTSFQIELLLLFNGEKHAGMVVNTKKPRWELVPHCMFSKWNCDDLLTIMVMEVF